jgi:AraC-like DNA-binding protein
MAIRTSKPAPPPARRKVDPAHADSSFGFRVWREPIVASHETHAHVDVEGNFLIRGTARYLLAGRYQPLVPGRLAIFWGGIPHRLLDLSPDAEMAWLTVPIAWFMDWNPGERLVNRLLSGDLLHEPDPATGIADAAQLERWIHDLSADAPLLRTAALLEVRARVHRLGHAIEGDAAAATPSQDGTTGGYVERISAFLGTHFRNEIAMADVAAAVDLHPNYATTLFREACGMGPWDYLVRLRISHAQRLLLTTDLKITAVALDSGFGSLSRFYEAFHKHVGQTPRAYRATNASRGG